MDFSNNSNNKLEITKVLYYSTNEVDYWIYSVNEKGQSFNKYYVMSMNKVTKIPEIHDLDNPIKAFANVEAKSLELNENTMQYAKFLALKKIAENYLSKISEMDYDRRPKL